MTKESVASRLREAREERNLSRKVVSTDTGIGVSTLSEIESAKHWPGLEITKKLCDYYEVRMDYICSEQQEDMIKKKIDRAYELMTVEYRLRVKKAVATLYEHYLEEVKTQGKYRSKKWNR